MKVLSIRSEHAIPLCSGIKSTEYRSWSTDYRETLLIHSSGSPLPSESILAYYPNATAAFNSEVNQHIRDTEDGLIPLTKEGSLEVAMLYLALDKGIDDDMTITQAIIGTADVTDVVYNHKTKLYEWKIENACFLINPVRFIKGKLRLWNTPPVLEGKELETISYIKYMDDNFI